MKKEQIEELAASYAAGALDGEERRELEQLLADGDPVAVSEVARFGDVAAMIALAQAPDSEPAPAVRDRLLNQIRGKNPASKSAAKIIMPPMPGFKFVFGEEKGEWVQLPVPGASVKLLSMDQERGYAVVMGKLEAGASYPPHTHIHAEQVFVLSGDLNIGQQRMEAGDFHQADAGTTHDVNYSETGCTILAVISLPDLQAQMA